MHHVETLRVRWAEVDAQGIVFNGHYLNYLDQASTGFWRRLALPYPMAFEQLGVDWVLRSSQLDFLAPARFDEQLDVRLSLADLGRSSLTLDAQVHRGGQRLLAGRLVYVLVDRSSLASTALPEPLRDALLAVQRGEPALQVALGSWAQLGAQAQPIRQAVFVREQGIPADLEWDAADAHCLHAVAFNRLGQALGTGRLLEHVPGTAKIGRMAVLRSARGSGVGAQVLEALMQAARQQGQREVLLHAQASAVGFYRRAGFSARGEPFDEAGIEHLEMLCRL